MHFISDKKYMIIIILKTAWIYAIHAVFYPSQRTKLLKCVTNVKQYTVNVADLADPKNLSVRNINI